MATVFLLSRQPLTLAWTWPLCHWSRSELDGTIVGVPSMPFGGLALTMDAEEDTRSQFYAPPGKSESESSFIDEKRKYHTTTDIGRNRSLQMS